MPKGKTLADFRSIHDKSVTVPRKIRAALDAMAKEGADNWDYEGDFIKRAGISQSDMGAFRGQFEKHVVQVGGKNPKRIWIATTRAAEKFRATAGVS